MKSQELIDTLRHLTVELRSPKTRTKALLDLEGLADRLQVDADILALKRSEGGKKGMASRWNTAQVNPFSGI